jgi:putative transposase
VKFGFIKEWGHIWSQEPLCNVMHVTTRGFRKWLTRQVSKRQHDDMRVLPHIREQYGLSLGSYGRPRMTMELKEAGLDVGERRVCRLMKVTGIKPARTRKHRIITYSNQSLGIVGSGLDGNFTADTPNQKWAGDINYISTAQGSLCLTVILD